MNESELKKGEYYTSGDIKRSNCEDVYIWICNSNGNTNHSSRIYIGENTADSNRFAKVGEHCWNQHRLATPEEKHWLNKCIELNKFISKEEAMKSFVPEYVKCTFASARHYTVNKIYKVDNLSNRVIDNHNDNSAHWDNSNNSQFEPSTKEAYDLQELQSKFVVGRWYEITNRQTTYIINVKSFNGTVMICEYRAKINEYRLINNGGFLLNEITNYIELTLEEIQQYLPDNHVDKIKKPVLFTTYDGVPITENDTFYWFRKTNGTDSEPIGKYEKYSGNPTQRSTRGNYLFFSSEEACKRHLELIQHNTINRGLGSKTDLITVQLTKEKYDLLMQLLEE